MSTQKVSPILLIASLLVLAIGLSVLLAPQTAVAQCGDPKPSCCTCHATAHPVTNEGEWHTIHARKECCSACHGGNDRTAVKETAHAGMTLHPLQDTYLACHQCHPDDYQRRAEVFAVALHVTPQSSEPLTKTVVFQPPDNVPPLHLAGATTAISAANPTPGLLVLVGLVALLLMGLGVIWRRLAHA